MIRPIEKRLRASVALDAINGNNIERAICNGQMIEAAEEIKRLNSLNAELLAACKEFVRKVECGEARSKRSYTQMKAAIQKAEGKP